MLTMNNNVLIIFKEKFSSLFYSSKKTQWFFLLLYWYRYYSTDGWVKGAQNIVCQFCQHFIGVVFFKHLLAPLTLKEKANKQRSHYLEYRIIKTTTIIIRILKDKNPSKLNILYTSRFISVLYSLAKTLKNIFNIVKPFILFSKTHHTYKYQLSITTYNMFDAIYSSRDQTKCTHTMPTW